MQKGVFSNPFSALFLLLPQVILISAFFYWPVIKTFFWSFHLEPPFGGDAEFVGFENFATVFSDPEFYQSINRSILFMVTASVTSVGLALILAVAADRQLRLAKVARNVIIWPKAVAGASIGMALSVILNPYVGVFASINEVFPNFWNPGLNGTDATILLNIAYIWGNIPFNFIVLLAGLQAVPHNMVEAAAMDGASIWRRLYDIQIPMLTPQLFLCMIIEINESFTSAFALIDSITQGGPAGATNLFVYKIYVDAFKAYDLSGAATQAFIMMLIVMTLALFQFIYLEKKVKYNR